MKSMNGTTRQFDSDSRQAPREPAARHMLDRKDCKQQKSPPAFDRPVEATTVRCIEADAKAIPLSDGAVDLVVTSPPYWLKRDYGLAGQIGQEATAQEYIANLIACMKEWKRILPAWGSIFLNIGDTYRKGSLAAIPSRLEIAAQVEGWTLRNRIIWAKDAGKPDPAKDRLNNRHEHILHFTMKRRGYYYDQLGYAIKYSNGTGPSDVWRIGLRRDAGGHLAPFPEELVERVLTLACPQLVCSACGTPTRRIVKRTTKLNPERPQARRAIELAEKAGLTNEHIAAIQATGISDAGKAMKTQTGTGRNAQHVKKLAAEAKAVLGGYFREFTFAIRETAGWSTCDCGAPFRPGIVMDPFVGTGTTLRVARSCGRSAVGVDLRIEDELGTV